MSPCQTIDLSPSVEQIALSGAHAVCYGKLRFDTRPRLSCARSTDTHANDLGLRHSAHPALRKHSPFGVKTTDVTVADYNNVPLHMIRNAEDAPVRRRGAPLEP